MRPRTFSQMQIAISNLTFVSYHPCRKFDAQDNVAVAEIIDRSKETGRKKCAKRFHLLLNKHVYMWKIWKSGGYFWLKKQRAAMSSIEAREWKMMRGTSRGGKGRIRRAGIVFLADSRRRRELYRKSWHRSRAWWICCRRFAGNENTLYQVASHLSLIFYLIAAAFSPLFFSSRRSDLFSCACGRVWIISLSLSLSFFKSLSLLMHHVLNTHRMKIIFHGNDR